MAAHVAFALVLFASFTLRIIWLSVLVTLVGAAYALAAAARVRAADRRERALIIVMLLGPASLMVIGLPRVGWPELFHAAEVAAVVGVAFAATRDPEVFLAASRWTLVGTQVLVLAYVAQTGVLGNPLEQLIPDSSSNGITSYLLVLQVCYGAAVFVLRRRIALWTMLVTAAICVVGYGRGSIIASFMLLGGSMLYSLAARHSMSRTPAFRIPAVLVALVLSVTAVRYAEDISGFAGEYTKFGVALGDYHRDQINKEYFEALTPATVVVGGSFDGTVIAREYNNNPHNSFIRAHHIFGLFYLLSLALLPFLALPRAGSWADQAYLLFAIAVLYLRAFTEPILFPTLLDYFFMGMCFVMVGMRPNTASVGAAPALPDGQWVRSTA